MIPDRSNGRASISGQKDSLRIDFLWDWFEWCKVQQGTPTSFQNLLSSTLSKRASFRKKCCAKFSVLSSFCRARNCPWKCKNEGHRMHSIINNICCDRCVFSSFLSKTSENAVWSRKWNYDWTKWEVLTTEIRSGWEKLLKNRRNSTLKQLPSRSPSTDLSIQLFPSKLIF